MRLMLRSHLQHVLDARLLGFSWSFNTLSWYCSLRFLLELPTALLVLRSWLPLGTASVLLMLASCGYAFSIFEPWNFQQALDVTRSTPACSQCYTLKYFFIELS